MKCSHASAYCLYGSVAHDYAIGTYKTFASVSASGMTQSELLGNTQISSIFVNPSDKVVEIYIKGSGFTADSGCNVDILLKKI